jgi:uncharacterized iron-regulated membrane protein
MTAVEQTSSAASFPWRRWLLRIHLWIGIVFCIPFALLGITGSILVYDQDVLAPPRATAVGEMQRPAAILNAAAAANPGYRATQLILPAAAGDPATVRLAREERSEGRRLQEQTYVDPVSLAILAPRQAFRTPFIDFVHGLHGSLALGGRTGRPIVGWLGVGMTILGITGLFLWWPQNGRWRNAVGVRKDARGWLLHRQLHATAGILGWIVFVAVSFSGVAISFPQSFGPGFAAMFGGEPQARVPAVEEIAGTQPIGVDRAIELALQAAPDAHLAAVFLPANAKQPYRVQLIANDALDGAPAINIAIDPYKAEVTNLRDPRRYALGDTIMAWQRTIHGGRAFGPVWAFLVCVVGLLPPLFSVTGTTMWWLKRRSRLARRCEPAMEGVPAE